MMNFLIYGWAMLVVTLIVFAPHHTITAIVVWPFVICLFALAVYGGVKLIGPFDGG